MITPTVSFDDEGSQPGSGASRPTTDWDPTAWAYRDAVAVFQLHHDRPGTVGETELATALRPYLMRWDGAIRRACAVTGLSPDDVATVAQDVSVEFYRTRIVPGVFDPSRGEFAILKNLARQRAIDRYRHTRTRKELVNGLSVNEDPYADAPGTASAEDDALQPSSYEEAARRFCCGAQLDPRETVTVLARLVDGIDDWTVITDLANAAAPPPPVTIGRVRNIFTGAKKKLRTYLHDGDPEGEGGNG